MIRAAIGVMNAAVTAMDRRILLSSRITKSVKKLMKLGPNPWPITVKTNR